MTPEEATIDALRKWSHALLWVSILLPVLGALAAGARYYVERHEKRLSAQITATAVQRARDTAEQSQVALAEFKERSAPRRISKAQGDVLLPILRQLNGQPVAVACRMMDGESCDFATRLAVLLQQAGCVVPEPIKTSLNDFPGYLVITAHGDVPSDVLRVLEHALSAAQISARIDVVQQNSIGMWYQNAPHIVVGRKL